MCKMCTLPRLSKTKMAELSKCTIDDCNSSVAKMGYLLCCPDWQEKNKYKEIKPKVEIIKAEKVKVNSNYLSVTNLGELLNISSTKLNQVLSELGWLEKKDSGWVTTDFGEKLHGQAEIGRDKKTLVKWPADIAKSRVLMRAIKEFLNPESKTLIEIEKEVTKDAGQFRSKYSANMRATDGHLVRSRGEMLIDNWLYMSGIAHAYERQLPIEEEAFCDFYIPSGKVYIEYWGLEKDPKYLERKKVKREIYKKYALNLIELQDKHIENLDDYLPKLLLQFKVKVDLN